MNLFHDPADKNFAEDRRWKTLMIAIDACVPADQKEFVKEQLEDVKSDLWIDVGVSLFGRVFGNSLTLAIGFVVHTLASA